MRYNETHMFVKSPLPPVMVHMCTIYIIKVVTMTLYRPLLVKIIGIDKEQHVLYKIERNKMKSEGRHLVKKYKKKPTCTRCKLWLSVHIYFVLPIFINDVLL